MRKLNVVLVLFILILTLGFVSAGILEMLFSPETRPVRVYVRDTNGNAVSGAAVIYKQGSTTIGNPLTTGTNGITTSSISLNIGQTYNFHITKTGYNSVDTQIVTILSGTGDQQFSYTMTPTAATTRQVRVLIKDNLGNPLSGAIVKFKIGTTIAFTQTTDSNGYTPYVNLNVGEYYTGEASKTGYSTNTWNIGTIVSGSAWSIGPYVLTSTTPCVNECTSGMKRCSSDNKGRQTCGNYDTDSCTEWTPIIACNSGETCSNGDCVISTTPCVNECTSGDKRCSSDNKGRQTCGNYDTDSCTEWTSIIACNSGETCSNGACVSSNITTPEPTRNPREKRYAVLLINFD